MQIDIPDSVVDVIRDSLTPVIEQLITERIEQRRPMLLSVHQVAEELSCSRSSVYGLIHGGHLEAVRIGQSYRVATTTLQDYVEELTKPAFQRDVVTAHTRQTRATPSTRGSEARRARQPSASTVIPATRPPRSPRPRPKKKMSQKEFEDSRWTLLQLAERWWGLPSATALVERSGVELTPDGDGQETFRYGDLLAWAGDHKSEFEQWCEDFDPVLRRASGVTDEIG